VGALFSRAMTLVPAYRTQCPFNPLLFLDFLATSFIELELQVGVGRDDGKSAGEFNPIFYRR
jgi:hypothetical protein